MISARSAREKMLGHAWVNYSQRYNHIHTSFKKNFGIIKNMKEQKRFKKHTKTYDELTMNLRWT